MRSAFGKDIRSLVFDLDGTLYACRDIGMQIEQAAVILVAESHGLSLAQGQRVLQDTRRLLAETPGEQPPLSRTCLELGLDLRDFVRVLDEKVRPENHLRPDGNLETLLRFLRYRYALYIYTNNGFSLASRILSLLGVADCFCQIYSLEFAWRPKPDTEALQSLLAEIGGLPEHFLFIGDRYHVDLREPANLGIEVFPVAGPGDLMQLPSLLGITS
jgi:putative hydrolase of the HAD superfamily